MILDTNAIKWLIKQMKEIVGGQSTSPLNSGQNDDLPHLVSLLSYSDECKGRDMPNRIGTAKLKKCVTLQPLS